MIQALNIYTSGIFITLVLWFFDALPNSEISFVDALAVAVLWPLHLGKLAIKHLKDE